MRQAALRNLLIQEDRVPLLAYGCGVVVTGLRMRLFGSTAVLEYGARASTEYFYPSNSADLLTS